MNITIGFLAHVDAGKTTLSEAVLYQAGTIRKAGRVDHGDAFLDTDAMERERGITVFSKEARFRVSETNFTLLDTPGHADFSTEMERTLRVLDYAVLLISGTEGVQSHTMTLWKLLKTYHVPTIIFVNKMDMPEADRLRVWNQLKVSLGQGLFEMEGQDFKEPEDVASCTEELMDAYLDSGEISDQLLACAIADRQAFPVCYGSALKMEGTENLLQILGRFATLSRCAGATLDEPSQAPFAATVYKISRDKNGVRQTHLKVESGTLKNKMLLSGTTLEGEEWSEKVEQIRLYNSTGFDTASEATAGEIVAVTGLNLTFAGQRIGDFPGDEMGGEAQAPAYVLQPALTYRVNLVGGGDNLQAVKKFALLEEENPSYHFIWDEEHREIHVQVMGDLELEVLGYQIKERLGLEVTFDQGSIIYKETIAAPVIGVGHFEPLRHYAEVQLLMEPLPTGSGLEFGSLLSEDVLAKNWQRLIMTHLTEKRHRGTLTNSELTDMRISIVAGAASSKHTEGGDFRKATYRAIRQGLRKLYESGQMVLLEPVYSFTIEVPTEYIGRVMSDMDRLSARCEMPDLLEDGVTSVIRGVGPVATLRDYQREINTFARGSGRIMASLEGYRPAHNQEAAVAEIGYEPDNDGRNLSGSVFCEHGAGVYVDWQDVDEMAHTEAVVKIAGEGAEAHVVTKDTDEKGRIIGDGSFGASGAAASVSRGIGGVSASAKELDAIFEKTYGKSKRDEQLLRAHQAEASRSRHLKSGEIENFPQPKWHRDEAGASGESDQTGDFERLVIVDGYNVIFAWEYLKELAKVNIDSAREELLDVLENYAAATRNKIIAVFDGYRVSGNPGTNHRYGAHLEAVYTKEGETADHFIEKTVYELTKGGKRAFNGGNLRAGADCGISVVTSDRLVQMTAMGDGAVRWSSLEFFDEVNQASESLSRKLRNLSQPLENRPFDGKL